MFNNRSAASPCAPSKVFFVFFMLYKLMECCLIREATRRQRKLVASSSAPPRSLRRTVKRNDFERCKNYTFENLKAQEFESGYIVLVTLVFLYYLDLSVSWSIVGVFGQNMYVRSVLFAVVANAAVKWVYFPVEYYRIVFIENKFRVKQQSIEELVLSMMTATLLETALIVPQVCISVYLMLNPGTLSPTGSVLFHMSLRTFMFVLQSEFLVPALEPGIELPRSGDFGDLAQDLALRAGFPFEKIIFVRGSDEVGHLHGLVCGQCFWKSRIVLYESLIEGASVCDEIAGPPPESSLEPPGYDQRRRSLAVDSEPGPSSQYPPIPPAFTRQEVLSILCHEMGHWKKSHRAKLFILESALHFFKYMVFLYVVQIGNIRALFGFTKEDSPIAVAIGVDKFLLQPLRFASSLVLKMIERVYEQEADDFVWDQGLGNEFATALAKILPRDLNYPELDPVYKTLFTIRRSPAERIARLTGET